MAIKMSQRAVQRVQRFLQVHGKGIGLRVGIKTTGCLGFSYVLDVVDQLNADDMVFEEQGIKVIIADKNLAYLRGMELDFVKEGVNEGFKFNNPNVKDQCGCGVSVHF